MNPPQRRALIIAIFLGAGVWGYLFGVFLPYQESHEQPGASRTNRSDLYPRWLGTRELLLHGRNPYSPEVTQEIQLGYYGKAVLPGSFPNDEQRFAYPLYIVFFLAPTIALPFSVVNAAFGVLLLAATIASVLLWIRALNLRVSRRTMWLCALVVLGSWPVAEGLYARQLSLLVAFLLALAAAEISRGRFRIAGLCLGCSMMKPQLSLLVTAWFLLWALGGWPKRKSLVWSFIATIGVLLLGAEWILPRWFEDWSNSLPAYVSYTGSKSSLERLLGTHPGFIAGLILAVAVAAACWKSRKHSATSDGFGFASTAVFCATMIVLPTWSLASYNEILLIPPVLWLCSRWRNGEIPRAQIPLWILAGVALSWESVCSSVLAVASRFPGFSASEHLLRIPLALYFLTPLIVGVTLVAARPRLATSPSPT